MHTSYKMTELTVTRALEHDIIFGRLLPGQRLREDTIIRELGATRHHVRAALRNLEKSGIVVRERNKGASVRAYTTEEVLQLYDIREMLTRQAALRIPLPVTPGQIDQLQNLQTTYEAAVKDHWLPAIHDANDRFHATLFGLSNNPYLVDLLQRSMDMTYIIRAADMADPVHLAEALAEHRMIVSMLTGTDSWALAEMCVRHLQPSKEAYLRRLQHEDGRRSDMRSR